MRLGAQYEAGRCKFVVWAPYKKKASLVLSTASPETFEMEKAEFGYWSFTTEHVRPDTKYKYLLDGTIERPDPASHFQPEGVHGPSAVVDHNAYPWTSSSWHGISVEDMLLYEMHVGTFTHEGTFYSALPRVADLSSLGVNAVEIMPVAQFVGHHNWGYDGVYPYSVQNSYGGPNSLKRFVDECHTHGIAVILDFVLNHMGLEGNYVSDFGPYFTGRYRTAWGPAINFDGPWSNEVRNYFLQCAFHWLENYRIDGFRLDAIHAILDNSPKHFLAELSEAIDKFSATVSRKICLIAESDLNDSKVVKPREAGGFGIDAQWLDDFHHSLHTSLTGEEEGYYKDFEGIRELLKSLREGYVYSGQYSEFRGKKHGNSSADIPPRKFVVFSQNHDQVGNRRLGERLMQLAGLEAAKLAAGIVVLSPYLPLLFMGEEYGENSPFLYFTSYENPQLAQAVRNGRKAEFAKFSSKIEPPDPQSSETFEKSKIRWERRYRTEGKKILDYYRALIRLRTMTPAFGNLDREAMRFFLSEDGLILFMERWTNDSAVAVAANFNKHETEYTFPFEKGRYQKTLDSADMKWLGPGSKIPVEAAFGDKHLISGLTIAVFVKTLQGEQY